ncbi:DUF3450 domain-containing protein [Halodesulfovibrio sp.]|jgi:hypothetical protein|uniref:DUF3450 domain-containing protein n=1 Tax=Halodesulfovibrio sp. TaxID=1912772 RepID=UPI0025FE1084|nr:DUF3450 domain-containing protein [Halodesulfovibrio sp.]MCT4626390.1 DUF3450 domain-containing protein [Halodesulfovibrio sp.]
MKNLSYFSFIVTLCLLLTPRTLLASTSTAQSIVTDTITSEQRAQKKISAWQQKKPAIIAEIQHKQLELDWLTHQKNKYTAYVATIEDNIAEMERQNQELDTIANAVSPLLQSTLDHITAFIDEDIPFLSQERQQRIASIKKVLADPHAPQAEQLRRMLEVLEIETAYGSGIELEDEEVLLGDSKIHTTTLRAGRLGYYCISPDKEKVGIWSSEQQKFIPIEGEAATAVLQLQHIAHRKQIIEVTPLPLTIAVQSKQTDPTALAVNTTEQEEN